MACLAEAAAGLEHLAQQVVRRHEADARGRQRIARDALRVGGTKRAAVVKAAVRDLLRTVFKLD